MLFFTSACSKRRRRYNKISTKELTLHACVCMCAAARRLCKIHERHIAVSGSAKCRPALASRYYISIQKGNRT